MRMPMSFAAHLDLTALCKEGQLNELPHNLLTTHTPSSNSSTYLQLVHAAIAKNVLSQGKQLHSHIIQWGIAFATRTFFQNNLINMYVKCGSLVDARRVFDDMKEPDDFSWNAIIAAYRRHRLPYEALTLFLQMQRTGAQPNQFTIASVLPACAKIKALEQGMDIHHSIMGRGFLTDVVVVNALIDMYAKCGCIQKARELFDKMPQRNVISWNSMIAGYVENGVLDEALRLFKEMPQRNVVSWNSMITGYAQNGLLDDAVRLLKEMPRPDTVSWNAIVAGYAQNGLVEKASEAFKKMQLAGLKPNSATFASILPACAKMGALEQGMDIHQSIIETGFLLDVVVASALVDMYAKCGSIHKARELFDKMSQRDVVLWNAMIAGYAQNGFVEKALEVFKQIQLAHLKPNCATFASILPACATMGALEQGMDIHQSIIESGFLPDVIVASALIDMYAKCGSIQKARQLFDKMPLRNVISWNSMIAGYAQNGFCKDALELFELMKQSGASPNHVSFTCVLFACSHAGLVDEGYKYFNDMSDSYCITPTVDHYVCMVDLLGRAGYLEESLKLIIKMPIKPPGVVWKCLLGACRSHKNIEIGIFIASLLFELDPKNDATYVLLSNIYAEVGSWNEVQLLRKLMKDREIKKTPGCSWIEVHKMVHVFGVGDRSHPQTQEMYAKLEELLWEMKAAGYFPDSRHALNDVEQEEKETFTCHHSEKLAIAFGLLNTPPRTTIRVVKNLRVCVDCHSATKFISNIAARQIVVRDANRFHHFKQGECSCGDYW